VGRDVVGEIIIFEKKELLNILAHQKRSRIGGRQSASCAAREGRGLRRVP
jgi:hypothetical protein